MSRIGKKLIPVPDKVSITIDGQNITVKGPKGELQHTLPPTISVVQEDGNLSVVRPNDERQNRALHGLTRALIANMVTGVNEGFQKTLVIEGVGYTSEVRGENLVLRLGKSHEDVVEPPAGIQFAASPDRGRTITVSGIDKQVVGQIAANIRKLRPPEPYKGKGIRYSDERIRRKAGKTGK